MQGEPLSALPDVVAAVAAHQPWYVHVHLLTHVHTHVHVHTSSYNILP